jgi:hypothetical protein
MSRVQIIKKMMQIANAVILGKIQSSLGFAVRKAKE